MWAQIIKVIVIGLIVYTAICLWVQLMDPSVNCNPLTVVITLITSILQALLCVAVGILNVVINIPIQIIASIFNITINPVNIPCPTI